MTLLYGQYNGCGAYMGVMSDDKVHNIVMVWAE